MHKHFSRFSANREHRLCAFADRETLPGEMEDAQEALEVEENIGKSPAMKHIIGLFPGNPKEESKLDKNDALRTELLKYAPELGYPPGLFLSIFLKGAFKEGGAIAAGKLEETLKNREYDKIKYDNINFNLFFKNISGGDDETLGKQLRDATKGGGPELLQELKQDMIDAGDPDTDENLGKAFKKRIVATHNAWSTKNTSKLDPIVFRLMLRQFKYVKSHVDMLLHKHGISVPGIQVLGDTRTVHTISRRAYVEIISSAYEAGSTALTKEDLKVFIEKLNDKIKADGLEGLEEKYEKKDEDSPIQQLYTDLAPQLAGSSEALDRFGIVTGNLRLRYLENKRKPELSLFGQWLDRGAGTKQAEEFLVKYIPYTGANRAFINALSWFNENGWPNEIPDDPSIHEDIRKMKADDVMAVLATIHEYLTNIEEEIASQEKQRAEISERIGWQASFQKEVKDVFKYMLDFKNNPIGAAALWFGVIYNARVFWKLMSSPSSGGTLRQRLINATKLIGQSLVSPGTILGVVGYNMYRLKQGKSGIDLTKLGQPHGLSAVLEDLKKIGADFYPTEELKNKSFIHWKHRLESDEVKGEKAKWASKDIEEGPHGHIESVIGALHSQRVEDVVRWYDRVSNIRSDPGGSPRHFYPPPPGGLSGYAHHFPKDANKRALITFEVLRRLLVERGKFATNRGMTFPGVTVSGKYDGLEKLGMQYLIAGYVSDMGYTKAATDYAKDIAKGGETFFPPDWDISHGLSVSQPWVQRLEAKYGSELIEKLNIIHREYLKNKGRSRVSEMWEVFTFESETEILEKIIPKADPIKLPDWDFDPSIFDDADTSALGGSAELPKELYDEIGKAVVIVNDDPALWAADPTLSIVVGGFTPNDAIIKNLLSIDDIRSTTVKELLTNTAVVAGTVAVGPEQHHVHYLALAINDQVKVEKVLEKRFTDAQIEAMTLAEYFNEVGQWLRTSHRIKKTGIDTFAAGRPAADYKTALKTAFDVSKTFDDDLTYSPKVRSYLTRLHINLKGDVADKFISTLKTNAAAPVDGGYNRGAWGLGAATPENLIIDASIKKLVDTFKAGSTRFDNIVHHLRPVGIARDRTRDALQDMNFGDAIQLHIFLEESIISGKAEVEADSKDGSLLGRPQVVSKIAEMVGRDDEATGKSIYRNYKIRFPI